ncbi:hypothetical protein D3C87_2189990 [compost metagenome]
MAHGRIAGHGRSAVVLTEEGENFAKFYPGLQICSCWGDILTSDRGSGFETSIAAARVTGKVSGKKALYRP